MGNSKALNVFSQESKTREGVFTPVRSFSKCSPRRRKTVCKQNGEKYWDLEKPCVGESKVCSQKRKKTGPDECIETLFCQSYIFCIS